MAKNGYQWCMMSTAKGANNNAKVMAKRRFWKGQNNGLYLLVGLARGYISYMGLCIDGVLPILIVLVSVLISVIFGWLVGTTIYG